MEFDTVKRDSTISQEQSADYWREKAECLEEWVCELLRKNQALRMDLQKQQSQRRHFEETPLAFSLISLYRSPFPSARPAFRAESPKLVVDAGTAPCPRKECGEIRESVVENVMNKSVRAAND